MFIIVGLPKILGDDVDDCLNCICRGKNHCGIQYGFWADAGKLGGDYNQCMSDPICPKETMKQYYLKHEKV